MALEQLSLEQFRLGCIILFYFKMEFEKSSAEMNYHQDPTNLQGKIGIACRTFSRLRAVFSEQGNKF